MFVGSCCVMGWFECVVMCVVWLFFFVLKIL